MVDEPSQAELEAAHCWEPDDRVPGRPEMTAFRRRLRLRQARWREANGHPIGTQPLVPRPDKPSRPLGSRLPLDHARDTGANFLTPAAREAARERAATPERHQTFDHQRLWADLLWSPSLAFNVFGGAATAERAVRTLAPDAPGRVAEVRFAHSPGRLDPSYLNSLRAFDAAFVLELRDGSRGILAVATIYHEWLKPETPRPDNLARYLEVADRSRAFAPGAADSLKRRSGLAVTWLEHLLLLSMLQHASGTWRWGRYVVVHPAGNSDYAEGCARYRTLLADDSTFASRTLEELVEDPAVRARYLQD